MRVLENPLHPHLLRLEVDVFSEKALAAALAAHPDRGFICTVDENNASAAAILSARGFTHVRRTHEGDWQGDSAQALPDFEHGTLAQRPDLTAPWLAAHRHHYAATHRANPEANLDAQRWDEIFIGDDFWPESAFYILAKDAIAGFSSLRPNGEGWELAWFGTTPENHPAFTALNAGLVALETDFMAKRGIASVLAEWDSTSADAAWRGRRYTLGNQRKYLTFVLI